MTDLWAKYDYLFADGPAGLHTEIATRGRSADAWGTESLLADPDPVLLKQGQDISLYRRLLSDAHVWCCYQNRKSGTLSCHWEVRPPARSKGNRHAENLAYGLISDLMEPWDMPQIISDMLDAPFYGISPLEVIWDRSAADSGGGHWLPSRIMGRPPEWFAFDQDNRLRFLSREHLLAGQPIPEKKILLVSHHATYQNPYGERLLGRCFWPVTFKKSGLKFWSIFTEKFGMPWVVGKVPRGTGERERARIMVNLDRMVQDAIAVINDDERIEFPEAHGKQASADLYHQLIALCNHEISKAILGQTLTTEVAAQGSYAAAAVHLNIQRDLIEQDKRLVSAAFNQLFGWITELNWAAAAPPRFVFQQTRPWDYPGRLSNQKG